MAPSRAAKTQGGCQESRFRRHTGRALRDEANGKPRGRFDLREIGVYSLLTLVVRFVLGGLLAFALPAASTAEAGPMRATAAISFESPARGARLQAGDVVQIRWSGVPAATQEMELLLSLDGGRHYSLRLTRELGSGTRSFSWRVPNLQSPQVALALRVGIGGRELTSDPGPLFCLEADPGGAIVPLRWESGEMWADHDGDDDDDDDGDSRRAPSLPAARLSTTPDELISLPEEAGAIDSPRSLRVDAIPASAFERPNAIPRSPRTGLWRSLSRAPASIPQRI